MTRELTPVQQYQLEQAWIELDMAKAYADQNRLARAQESLRQALTLGSNLPRWFTDDLWSEQYQQLHKRLYSEGKTSS